MTALLDAIGQALRDPPLSWTMIEANKNTNVIVVIVTDGYENSSRSFTKAQIRSMIQKREAMGWSFVFVGAGVDAFAEASSMGISSSSTLRHGRNAAGIHGTYAVMDAAVSTSRLTGASVKFSAADQAATAATDPEASSSDTTTTTNTDSSVDAQ